MPPNDCQLLRQKYQRFLDALLELYRDAKRAAADGRLGEAGRQERVAQLEDRLCALCLPYQAMATANLSPPEHDFCNLANELLEWVLEEELFTFVLHVAGLLKLVKNKKRRRYELSTCTAGIVSIDRDRELVLVPPEGDPS